MKRSRLTLILLKIVLIYICTICVSTHAHLGGFTETTIEFGRSQVLVNYTLPKDSLKELGVTFSAGQEAIPENIAHKISQGFKIYNGGRLCELLSSDQTNASQILSTKFKLTFQCSRTLDVVSIDYNLFFDRFKGHKNFSRIILSGKTVTHIFSSKQLRATIPVKQNLANWGETYSSDFEENDERVFDIDSSKDYFPLGIEHILIGFDHLLFLFALLLLPLTVKELLILVTSFTVAHSITLAFSVFQLVSLPVLWVEAVIALSIIYVGAENLWELRRKRLQSWSTPWKRRVMVTSAFGLIHGFGFSFVLQEIGLGDNVAGALFFFNLGVEVGQLITVALVFPILAWIFKRSERFLFSEVCSVIVVILGAIWFFERVALL